MREDLTHFKNYRLADWIQDPEFQYFIFNPDPVSIQAWADFFKENPGLKNMADEAKGILIALNQPSFELDNTEIGQLWHQIKSEPESNKRSVQSSLSFKDWMGWSAAAVLLVGIFVFSWWITGPTKYVEYTTEFGETARLVLPDSSEVILNSNSRLTFSADWLNHEKRIIHLTGEAFFNVKHLMDHRPFVVIPKNGIEIEVLGTSFNVYERRSQTRVVLNEGKVALKFSDTKLNNIQMVPGDFVEVSSEKISIKQVDAGAYTSWTQNLLTLDHTPLSEIIQVAEENFGLTVSIDPTLSLTQTASGSSPLEDEKSFMTMISKVFGFKVEKKESIYHIY